MRKLPGPCSFLALLFIILVTASCSKSSGPAQCQLAKITSAGASAGTTVYNISYDSLGRIAKVIFTGTVTMTTTNIYSGNGFLREITDSGSNYTSIDSVEFNSKGMIGTIYSMSGTAVQRIANYIYDNSGELTKIVDLDQQGKAYDSTVYTWKNGDLQTDGYGFYQYGTSPNKAGNYFQAEYAAEGLDYKLCGLNTTHLLSNQTVQGQALPFSYTYNSGNISAITMSAAGNNSTLFNSFSCK